MDESEFQERVSDAVINRKTDKITLGITDNGFAVIIRVDEGNAAYTADEARELAQAIEDVADERWGQNADDIVEYIRDLADIADRHTSAEDVEEKWDEKGRQHSV